MLLYTKHTTSSHIQFELNKNSTESTKPSLLLSVVVVIAIVVIVVVAFHSISFASELILFICV